LHEIGIASSILEIVYAEARKRPGENIIAVGLRIGELSSISPDAHTFAFETLTRETP
jgi:Zn finger protein HypA/HybF involved in hydrogenase expression